MFWLTKKTIDLIKSQLIETNAETPYVRVDFNIDGKKAELTTSIREWSSCNVVEGITEITQKLTIPSWFNVQEFSKDSDENSYWLPLTAFIACCEAIKGEKYIKIESNFDYDTKCTRFEITGIKNGKKFVVNRKWNKEHEDENEDEDWNYDD